MINRVEGFQQVDERGTCYFAIIYAIVDFIQKVNEGGACWVTSTEARLAVGQKIMAFQIRTALCMDDTF